MLLAEPGAPDWHQPALVGPSPCWLAGWRWLEGQELGSLRSGGLTRLQALADTRPDW